jgi:DNA polymerase-3 subunit epsilon
VFAPQVRFVDIETTGMDAGRERITEIGVVAVDVDGDAIRVDEWSTLVNPQRPVPSEIRWLTGIDNEMLRAAPPFAAIADELIDRLRGALFVAHNARFDYGFLRAEFARAGFAWRAPTLCTVRLSRMLYPDRAPHSLDAIIDRFGIDGEQRHRALGDARALWRFVDTLYRRLPRAEIDAAVERLLSRPSTPSRLAPEALDEIPNEPGVYLFFGANPHPIYIGKSRDLKSRVAAHFSDDARNPRDAALSREVERVEWETANGELGALLREAELVKTRLPAHNIRLRRRQNAVVMTLDDGGRPRWHPAADSANSVEGPREGARFGPFASRAAGRARLASLAAEHALCLKTLGLEGGAGAVAASPCFNHQLHRCRGACIGAEDAASHRARLAEHLQPLAIPHWPYPGPVALIERSASLASDAWHVADGWCWLGSARSAIAAGELARSAERRFDADIYHLLRRALDDDSRRRFAGVEPIVL